ncbi:hypothetical protein TKK_0012253 [Trichogramma kaykai]
MTDQNHQFNLVKEMKLDKEGDKLFMRMLHLEICKLTAKDAIRFRIQLMELLTKDVNSSESSTNLKNR